MPVHGHSLLFFILRKQNDHFQQSGSKYKCTACGKTFKNEHYIDLHMARFHEDKRNKSGICFADYCEELSCTSQPWLRYYDNPTMLAGLKANCTNVVKACFPTSDQPVECENGARCPKFRHHIDKNRDEVAANPYAAQTLELAFRKVQSDIISMYCERHPFEVWTKRKMYSIASWWAKVIGITLAVILSVTGLIYLLVLFVSEEDYTGNTHFYEEMEKKRSKTRYHHSAPRKRVIRKQD